MWAQSVLPATGPTVLPASPQVSAASALQPAGRARVVWSGGLLEITADNSSLNQILRQISRETGMKITGGVTDERVFGKYGPGMPAEILASLLGGTGSNMLLRETASKAPAELILTARQGGPTPPNPNAGVDEDSVRDEEPETPRPAPGPPSAPEPQAQPVGAGANAGAAGVNPAANGAVTPAAGAANPASPSGVQTPQQIFEQLQRLQQSQPQRPANPQ